MGLGKRRNERRKTPGNTTRKVLLYYSDDYLSRNMLFSLTMGMMFYSYWSAIVVTRKEYMIWTVPLVISILMKYELDLEKDGFGDPVDVLLHDIKSMVCITVICPKDRSALVI